MTTISILEEHTDYIEHEPSGLCCQLVEGGQFCPAKNYHQEPKQDQKMLKHKISTILGDSLEAHNSQIPAKASHVVEYDAQLADKKSDKQSDQLPLQQKVFPPMTRGEAIDKATKTFLNKPVDALMNPWLAKPQISTHLNG